METQSLYDLSKIKMLALEQGKNIQDIATEAGLTSQSIHQMVRNNTARFSTLQKIANVLGVSVDYFLRDSTDTSETIASDYKPLDYNYNPKESSEEKPQSKTFTKNGLLKKRQDIINALQKKVSNMAKTNADQETKIKEQESKIKEQESKIKEQESKINDQEQIISLLKESIKDKDTIIEILRSSK